MIADATDDDLLAVTIDWFLGLEATLWPIEP